MVATLFAGCGSKSGSKAPARPGGSDTADTTAGTGEVVDLEFPCIWVGADSKAEGFAQIVDSFNTENKDKYHVTIKEYTDYDAYADYIRTTISSGSAPELFSVKTKADVEFYSQSGKVLDMTDFLAGSDMAAKYSDGVIASEQIDGKNYALPWEAAIIPLMWNGKLLEQAGITNLPTTSADFLKTLEALKEAGVDTPANFMTANNAWTAMLWYSFALAENGGEDVYNGDWDTAAYEKAADFVKEVYAYAPSDAIGADAATVNGHFFNNETAVYTNGTWVLGNIQKNAADGVYDNLKFSAGPGNSIIQYTQAYILSGCTEDAAKQEAVKAFLSYITDADRLTALSNSAGSVFVPKTNAVENDYINQILALRDNASILLPSFESAVSTVAANDFSPQLEALVLGSIDSKTFVETLKADNFAIID